MVDFDGALDQLPSPGQPGPDQTRLALLGAGRMGQAIIAGLRASGWRASRIVAAEPDAATAREVAARHGIEVRAARDAVADADIVVVAVKPHHVTGVLDEVAPALPTGAVVVCIAAGVSTGTLAEHVPGGTPVVRVMPNTPALVGMGMSVLSAGPGCPPQAVALAREVLAAVGEVREVVESEQDAVTAVSGSGPAYVFYLAQAMIDNGADLGLDRALARDLTVQTLLGAATMLASCADDPEVLRAHVTSPGGTTAAAVTVLEDAGVRATVGRAMRACAERSAELGRP
ncbi:MAG: pyrroline-5-carboxylate reductase [Candidatus Nanopelagicales bacterium]